MVFEFSQGRLVSFNAAQTRSEIEKLFWRKDEVFFEVGLL